MGATLGFAGKYFTTTAIIVSVLFIKNKAGHCPACWKVAGWLIRLAQIKKPMVADFKSITFRRIGTVNWCLVTAQALLVLGILIRLVQYLANRSLWFDEAMIALNILDRGPFGLMQPLDYDQAAPILFLLLVKGTTAIFGGSEYVLRLTPLVMGIAGLIIFYKTARIYLTGWYVPVSVFLAAFSYELVYYSSEVKQYSTDVTVAIGCIFLLLKLLISHGGQKATIAWLGIAGLISIFLSQPSVFVLGGVGSALIFLVARRKLDISPAVLSIWLASWLFCFAVNYFVFIKPLTTDQGLHEYWQEGFLPVPLSIQMAKVWWRTAASFFNFLGYQSYSLYLIGALVATAAGIGLQKRQVEVLAILCIVFLTVAASMLKAYPFSERLILFLAPAVILMAVKGLELIGQISGGISAAVIAIALICPELRPAQQLAFHRILREEVRPAMTYLYHNRRNGDHVYVYFGASPAVRYYTRKDTHDEKWLFYGENARTNRLHYVQEIAAMRQYQRVWFIFSHPYKDEEEFFLGNMGGKLLDEYSQPGANLYLYEFDSPHSKPMAKEWPKSISSHQFF